MKQTYFRSTAHWYAYVVLAAVIIFLSYLLTHPCKRTGPGRCYSNYHFIDCTVCVER